MIKTCSKCRIEKPHDAFNKRRALKSGISAYCKACAREKALRHYSSTAEYQARMRVKRLYGLTDQQLAYWEWRSLGNCEMCGKPETASGVSDKPKRLSIDHCHDTGRIRGLLCFVCNAGRYPDDIARLSARIEFLQRTEVMA